MLRTVILSYIMQSFEIKYIILPNQTSIRSKQKQTKIYISSKSGEKYSKFKFSPDYLKHRYIGRIVGPVCQPFSLTSNDPKNDDTGNSLDLVNWDSYVLDDRVVRQKNRTYVIPFNNTTLQVDTVQRR